VRSRLGASAERGTAGVVSEAAALIDEYLGSLQIERGAALNTLTAYRRDLKGFETFLARDRRAIGERSIRRVDDHRAQVVGEFRELLDERCAPGIDSLFIHLFLFWLACPV